MKLSRKGEILVRKSRAKKEYETIQAPEARVCYKRIVSTHALTLHNHFESNPDLLICRIPFERYQDLLTAHTAFKGLGYRVEMRQYPSFTLTYFRT